MRNPFAVAVDRPRVRANAYEGAALNRLTSDWVFAPILSANQEIKGGHRTLVARGREIARNDPHGKRALSLFAINVVGRKGIGLQPRVRRADDEFDKPVNKTLLRGFQEWSRPENCSVTRRHSRADIERRAMKGLIRDGEAIVRMIPAYRGNRFGFALQEIDPDQLDITFNREAGNGLNAIRYGIEIDNWGAPVAYHLWSGHPSEAERRKRVPVPASEIIHLFFAERVGQLRGVTHFAPAMLRMHMLDGYAEAELTAARVGASKMGWFYWDTQNGAVPDPNLPKVEPRMEAEPGTFDWLPYGAKAQTFDPQHPNGNYDAFTKTILRNIATALDLSYSSLTGDLSDVNFSSIRAGILVEREIYMMMQDWMIDLFHRRIYAEWLKWSITTGALELPSFDHTAYLEADWQGRRWSWVDPEKEVNAAIKAIGAGLDSRTRITAEQGLDVEEIFADLDRENQLADEYAITLSLEPGKPAPADDEDRPRKKRNAAHLRVAPA